MWISIDRNSSKPLLRQIYDAIKHLILEGNLTAGEKLPSTRYLAKDLDVSRNTVLEAYSQLMAEGYLQGNQGSGTVVSSGISKHPIPVFTPSAPICQHKSTPDMEEDISIIDFQSGVPDCSFFPGREWGKCYQNTCDNLPESAFRYNSNAGVLELRQTIADYLVRTRGLNCNPKNILIVSGSTQGLSLVSKLFYGKNKKVLIEDPTHPGLKNIISKMGLSLTGIPADDYGLNTDLLNPSESIAFVYTTPSHQYPLGGVLPIQRRLALIQYAVSNHCYIVEDDYDSEFRFEGQPIGSLYELNPQKVIYLGTFSKILTPAIRLGYLILPDELLAPFIEEKKYSDVHTEALTQYALSEFIKNGSLEKHVWKMKKLYSKKRQHLIDALFSYFPGGFEIKGQAAGLHMVVKFIDIIFTQELVDWIRSYKVCVYPIENYAFQNSGNHENEILLGYAHLDLEEITDGIRQLSNAIHSMASSFH